MSTIPVLGAFGAVVFPGMSCRILLTSEPALAAVRAVVEKPGGREIAVFATRTPNPQDDTDLYAVGTVAGLVRARHCPCCGRWVVHLRGRNRARALEYVRWEPFREARVESLVERSAEGPLVTALALAVRKATKELHMRRPQCLHAVQAGAALRASRGADELPGAVSELFAHLPLAERQALLEAEPLSKQLEQVLLVLHRLLAKSDGQGRAKDWES